MIASQKGYQQIVEYLVDNNCQLDLVDKMGNTAIMRAAKGGRFHIIAYLVEKGGRIDLENKNQKSVMDYPAIRDLIMQRVVEKLREYSTHGNLELFKRYVSKYIDLNQTDLVSLICSMHVLQSV